MVGPNVLEYVRAPDTSPQIIGPASELMFFHGAPLAHVVAWENQLRATRKQIEMLRAYRDRRAARLYCRGMP